MSQGASSGNINVSLKCLSSFAWVKRVKRISLINPHFPSFIRLKSHSGIHRRLSKSRKFDFLHYQHGILKERKASTVESAKLNDNRTLCAVSNKKPHSILWNATTVNWAVGGRHVLIYVPSRSNKKGPESSRACKCILGCDGKESEST